MDLRIWLSLILFVVSTPTYSQGQDSAPHERDLQLMAVMLAGQYDNANQSYFDRRGDHSIKHRRLHLDVVSVPDATAGTQTFVANSYWDNDPTIEAGRYLWRLSPDADHAAVRMQTWRLENGDEPNGIRDATLAKRPRCDVFWRHEAAQFRAEGDCDNDMPSNFLLSEKQFWLAIPGNEEADYRMHRARRFECYADIPGVGGGRNEAYDRYDGLINHDQGGEVWFTSKEGRRLGISLFLVDWPINNYVGIYTRDSFVIYVNEEIDGAVKQISYAFTTPEADRIGINLKWMLASCFIESNATAMPTM